MKRFLSIVLAVAMVLSLAASYAFSVSAAALSGADTLEVGKATTAPDVTDGARDSQYTKVFDMSGPDCYDLVTDEETGHDVLKINDHFPIGFNSNERRYDKDEHPAEEDSDWYNTRAQGYMCWDESALYLFVEITGMGTLDDNPAVKWEGDGIQFAVYIEGRGTVETTYATAAGEIVTQNNVIQGAPAIIKRYIYGTTPTGADAPLAPEGTIMQKPDGTVVYEMKLEWKGIGVRYAPTVGSTLPFDLTINMNDENMVTDAFCGFQIGTGIFNESNSLHGGVQQSCKMKFVETVSHTHTDADGLWETDGNYHWHTCACGEVFDKVAHAGGTATCVNKAVCAVCNSPYGEVDSSNHVNTTVINDSPVSCENPGYTGDTYCNDCHQTVAYGTTIPAPGHSDADGQWETDGINHWHTCACGEEFDKEAHAGGTANCHTKAVCATCNASYGEFDADNHDGGTEIRDDAPASCNTPGYTGDTYCLGCGAKIASGTTIPATGAHVDADGQWETDGTYHWHTCACGEEFDKEAHAGGTATCHTKAVCATCNASYGEFDSTNHDGGTEVRDDAPASCNTPGYTGDTYCLGCGAKIASGTTIPATGAHVDADGEWETDGTNHWHTCACGEEFDKAEHSGGKATCHAKAVCATCDAAYGELDAENHDGGTEIRDDAPASCNTPGYTGDTYCLGCGAKIASGTTIPATGAHVDADGKWETDGTNHWHTCACGEEFDKAAHSGGTATCHTKAVCATCDAAYGELDADNHAGGTEIRDAVDATCVTDGYTGDTYCLGCGEKIATGTTIPATGIHVDADGKWETDGTNHWHTCACGEEFDKAEHSGGKATCHAKAVCATCDAAYGELDAENHDGGTEIRNASAATANAPGYTGDTYCLGCGEKLATGTTIPATPAPEEPEKPDNTSDFNMGIMFVLMFVSAGMVVVALTAKKRLER